MNSSENIFIGQVVKSKAGRDKGEIFLIISIINKENVLIVDGKLRKIANPKLKKLKHLIISNTVLSSLQESIDKKIEINDAYIRKLLEPYNKSF